MAKIVLTISADNKATQSVRLLNAEVQTLSKTLSTIKVNKNLTTQINALTKHYTAIANAHAKITANVNKQAIAEEKVRTQQAKTQVVLAKIASMQAKSATAAKASASKQVAAVEATRKGYANLISTLKTLKTQYADDVFGKLPNNAQRAFNKIQELSEALEKNGKLTKQQKLIYAQLSKQLKQYSADLATAKAKNDKIVAANPFTTTQAQQIPRLIKQYSKLLTSIKSTEKYYPKGTFDTFKNDLIAGQTQLNALNAEFQTTGTLSQSSQTQLNNLANSFNQLNASVSQTQSSLKSSKGSLLDIVTGFTKFQFAAMAVMKPLQFIRSALSSINETLVKTEDRVIELQRVVGDVANANELYALAEKYGQTFENVSEATLNFARRGMSWNESLLERQVFP